jgi:alpha-D-ribose 1-methylphosphonate 5-triphosphate synthase subunit PhnH
MLTIAPPDLLEARANATFEAIMWSIARPGEIRRLAEPGFAPIVDALLDLECVGFADDAETARLIAETGAEAGTDIGAADHVFIARLADAPADTLEAIARLNCGSALYPDEGATLVVSAAIGRGHRLRLTGPGIDGAREIALALPPAFWALREQLCSYPRGFDLFAVDGLDIVGIPRSTTVEVL